MMNSPMTNFELRNMPHREYKAEASRYWRQQVTKADLLGRSKGRKLSLALGGVGIAVVLFIQLLSL
jgi:hypothetical protein